MDPDTRSLVLLGAGYPAAVAVVVRWLAVVRERRWRWLAVHHLGVAAIVAGQLTARRPWAAAANGAWLVVSSAWFAAGGRRGR
jgi:hypothetical protein